MIDERVEQLCKDVAFLKKKIEEIELRIESGEDLNEHREDKTLELFGVIVEQMGDLGEKLRPVFYKNFPEHSKIEARLEELYKQKKPGAG